MDLLCLFSRRGFLVGRVGSGSYVASVGHPAPQRRGSPALVAPLSAFARRVLANEHNIKRFRTSFNLSRVKYETKVPLPD